MCDFFILSIPNTLKGVNQVRFDLELAIIQKKASNSNTPHVLCTSSMVQIQWTILKL